MAEESKIFYRVIVHGEEGLATIQKMNGQFVKTKVPVENLNQELNKLNGTLSLTTSQAGRQMSKFKKLRGDVQINSKEYQNLTKSMRMYQKQIDMSTGATGSASSAAMELGRVVSDMPYGIRGVANNLSQFASQMAYSAKSTGSLKLAVKDLFSALTGPLGILLIIQAVIAAFDNFAGSTKKSEEAIDSFNSPIAKAGSNLKILRQALNEGTISTEEANRAINKANSEYEDLNLKLDENNKLTDDSVISIDNKILALERLAKAQAIQSLIETEYSKTASARAKLDADLTEKGLDLKKLEIRKEEEKALLEGKTGVARRKIQRDFLTMNEKQGVALINNFNKIEKEGKESIQSLMNQLNEENLIDELFKSKGGKGKGKDRPLVEWFYNEMAGLGDIIKDENFDDISDTAKITGELIIKPTFVEYDEDFETKIKTFIERYQTIMTGLTSFVDGEFERQLTIEQNKTNALNEELNNRLLNESLSADQRKSIQNEIAQNDEKLRVKQEAIKRKAFNTEKAFNISIALIETYSAASSAFKNTLANPINKLLPDAGLLRAKINAGVAVAAGLLKVAAISRQKYQSSSAATPINTTGGGGGGGAGATERADPSFNIVGRSNENLLINAIQAQFDKPLKAYVVSRDVTNQQQLDGMIVSQAGT